MVVNLTGIYEDTQGENALHQFLVMFRMLQCALLAGWDRQLTHVKAAGFDVLGSTRQLGAAETRRLLIGRYPSL